MFSRDRYPDRSGGSVVATCTVVPSCTDVSDALFRGLSPARPESCQSGQVQFPIRCPPGVEAAGDIAKAGPVVFAIPAI